MGQTVKRIVLAYSGDLETSVAIPWLADRFGAEVIAVTLDLGQGRELTDIRERALSAGARRAHVLDVRDEFARDYVLPALQADALEADGRLLSGALAHPLIARKLVDIARMEGADAIAHGCHAAEATAFDRAIRVVDPRIEVIAPARLWSMSRTEVIDYARHHGIAAPDAAAILDSGDANLWGRSVVFEGSAGVVPDEVYTLTRAPHESPDEPAYIEIEFDAGVPARANGIDMPLVELIESVETIAGAHGVGRLEHVHTRADGARVREIAEAPAAVVLHIAHRALRTRTALPVNGLVRLKLLKGECAVETIAPRDREPNAAQAIGR